MFLFRYLTVCVALSWPVLPALCDDGDQVIRDGAYSLDMKFSLLDTIHGYLKKEYNYILMHNNAESTYSHMLSLKNASMSITNRIAFDLEASIVQTSCLIKDLNLDLMNLNQLANLCLPSNPAVTLSCQFQLIDRLVINLPIETKYFSCKNGFLFQSMTLWKG
jgi:hypothetical protein